MARNLTPQARQSVFSTTGNGEAWLVLLDIIGFSGSYYIVNNNEDIVSNGQVYTGYPFNIVLPEQDSKVVQQASITIDNVNKIFTDWIRKEEDPPHLKIKIVMASDPDNIEIEVDFLRMVNVSWDARNITATLNIDDLFNANFPSRAATYDPLQFPGLF